MADQTTRYILQFDADTRKLLQGLSSVTAASEAAGKKIETVGSMAKTAFSGFGFGDVAKIVAGTKFITGTVNAFGSLINVEATATQVFGESFDQISEWAKGAANAVGLSERAAIELTTKVAGLGKAAGLANEQLVGFSTQIVSLGADMAAAFNTSTTRAVEAVISAMSGSSIEPLREYNVILNDLVLKNELLEVTGEKVTGTMTQQQRTVAVYSKLLKSTVDYQGQFARESDQLQGTQQRLQAQLENTAAAIGEQYAPAALAALNTTLQLAQGAVSLDSALGHLPSAFAALAAGALALRPLTQRIGAFSTAMQEAGQGSTLIGRVAAGANPAILALGVGLIGLSLDAAEAAKGAGIAADGINQLAAASGSAVPKIKSFDQIISGWAKDESGADSMLNKIGSAVTEITAGIGDADLLNVKEARQEWDKLVESNVKGAVTIRDALAKNPAVAEEWAQKYHLSVEGMTEDINKQIQTNAALIVSGDAVDQQTQDVIDAMTGQTSATEDVTDATEDATKKTVDYNTALAETQAALNETRKQGYEFQQLIEDLNNSRLDRLRDGFETLFAADTGLDTLDRFKQINEIIRGFGDLTDIPSMSDIIFGEGGEKTDDLTRTFLDQMQALQDLIGPTLSDAVGKGGESELQRVGADWADRLRDSFIEQGFSPSDAQRLIEQLGLTPSALSKTFTLDIKAQASDEAQQLLDLALGQGRINFSNFLQLRAAVQVDPEKGLNAVQSWLYSQEDLKLPASLTSDVNTKDAVDFLEQNNIPIPASLKADAGKELHAFQGDVDAEPDVKVPMVGKLDLTTVQTQLNSFTRQPRTIVIGVQTTNMTQSRRNVDTIEAGLGASGTMAPVTQNIRTYITIPTADPSAMTRAATRWARLNGQPTPQITRGR